MARSVCWRGSARAAAAGEHPEGVVQPLGQVGSVLSTFTRAAAISIASGMPSSRWQMRASAAALSSVT